MSLMKFTEHYFEIPAREVARWLDDQGNDCWWRADGDPLLMGRLNFPCPGSEMAKELRRINKPLLLDDKNKDAQGQLISAKDLDRLVCQFGTKPADETPEEYRDRWFYLCWKDDGQDWVLTEDKTAAEDARLEALEQTVPR